MKSAFRIPTLGEIERTPWNGYTVVSTFSGCGGSCLGFRRAGFRVLWANEFVAQARATYRLNHTTPIVDKRDIRQISGTSILEAIGKRRGDIDVLEGSPPCVSYSAAGLKRKAWGQEKIYSRTSQRTDDLFFEFIRVLEELQPRVFVAENVMGMIEAPALEMYGEVCKRLSCAGYTTAVRGLDFQWLGVPQRRKRLIFIGVRDDLGLPPAFPRPDPYRYVLREALPNIVSFNRGAKDERGNPRSWYLASEHPYATITQNAGRTSINATFSANGFVLDVEGERRRLTIDEIKTISTIPSDFELVGTFMDQWERVARAVPPTAMFRIAEVIRDQILKRIRRAS